MIRKVHRVKRIIVGIALAASLASWTAQPALAFDGRSPDTRDAAEGTGADPVFDLRSPDTRDGVREASLGSQSIVDLRSPDARDAAHPFAREIPATAPAVAPSHQFDWGSFGLGIALASMLLLAAVAGAALVARKRRGEGVGPATT